jgi:TatA/E family protein of Tat protein translocase
MNPMSDIVWLLVLGFVALMIFGRRLPEMGKSLGKGIVEFKKGLTGVEDEMNKPALPAQTAPKGTLAAGGTAGTSLASKTTEEELRETRDQLRQLRDELRATKEEIAQAVQKPPAHS